MQPESENPPPVWALRLGYGGLVPFVVLAAAAWVAPRPWQTVVALALVAYAATIASFLGALHWGLVMRAPLLQSPATLLWGVTPSLLAWLALLVGPVTGLALLGALLGACYAVDRNAYPRFGAAQWLPLRLRLTAVAGTCCFAGAAALVLR